MLQRFAAGVQLHDMTSSSVVQLTVGGKAVLVPVSTIDSLATGIEPVTALLRLASGEFAVQLTKA